MYLTRRALFLAGTEEYPDYQAYKHIDENLFKSLKDYGDFDNLNDKLVNAARDGDIHMVKLLIDIGADDYNNAMKWAAIGKSAKHMEIVMLLSDLGADDYQTAMRWATYEGGNIGMVGIILDLGKKYGYEFDFNDVMEEAATEGNMEIVKMMLDLGANNYDDSLYNAARASNRKDVHRHDHLDIVKLMLEHGANANKYHLRGSELPEIYYLIKSLQ